MGAHIAGFAGKKFKALNGGLLGHITGLDPAGPCFYNNDNSLRLNSEDANFVDIIHTNAGEWGTIGPHGEWNACLIYLANCGQNHRNTNVAYF